MKALRYHGRGDVRLDDVPEPEPAAGEVKVRVSHNGICGTDVHEYFDGPIVHPVQPRPAHGRAASPSASATRRAGRSSP